eukprot:CAMPEP_0172841670 /NCGR_PEP_ID=MMETSP1075-20121228/30153_1 /TAXON_ID=2916 /ORGANISM="Ceratium fusus, Strain PA161109" /LENGTH=54 /DNA_ID=CAMNT_0013685675 /DNA_START=147 /DNA_END=311 /DNA_ORIENTATION=+
MLELRKETTWFNLSSNLRIPHGTGSAVSSWGPSLLQVKASPKPVSAPPQDGCSA